MPGWPRPVGTSTGAVRITARLIERQLEDGRHLSLHEAVQREPTVALPYCARGDFPADSRALLDGRDGQPR